MARNGMLSWSDARQADPQEVAKGIIQRVKALQGAECLYDRCTYFITDGVFVKIGVAVNLDQRLRTLQIGNPRPLGIVCLLPVDLETVLHNLFGKRHVRGEWFLFEGLIQDVCSHLKEPLEELRFQSRTAAVRLLDEGP